MNYTYAKDRFKHSPAALEEMRLKDGYVPHSVINARRMQTAKSASTLPGAKKEPKRRARRLRLNPDRRSRKDRAAARPREAMEKITKALATLRAGDGGSAI